MMREVEVTMKRKLFRVKTLRPCRIAEPYRDAWTAGPGLVIELEEATAAALMETGQVELTNEPLTED